MITRTRASVAGMAAIAVTSFLYMNRLGLQVDGLASVRTASMAVSDTNGLVVGSRVLLRGVPIGHVTTITSSSDHIEVALTYNSDYHIPTNSRFRLDNLSALGETYISVLPTSNSGPYLRDNSTIADANVTVPTTIKELSARLTRMLEQVDPNRIGEIFRTLDVALPDDAEVVGDLSRAGSLLAATVLHQSDKLTTLLSTMQPLLMDSSWMGPDLAGTTPELDGFGRDFKDMLNGLHFAVTFGPLRDAIKHGAGPLIAELQVFLDKTSADLNTLGVDILPAARSGAAAIRTVDVGRLLDNALASTSSGDSVTVHLRAPGK